jgi:hypothetical protein
MPNIFKPKYSNTPGKVPTTSDLADGEFAINTADKKIYQRVGTEVVMVADAAAGGSSSPARPYAPGSMTVPTGNGQSQIKRAQFTGTQRLTIAGTGRLSIVN